MYFKDVFRNRSLELSIYKKFLQNSLIISLRIANLWNYQLDFKNYITNIKLHYSR